MSRLVQDNQCKAMVETILVDDIASRSIISLLVLDKDGDPMRVVNRQNAKFERD
jgi:hypothetical protein